jgi:hypothetical protein
MLEVVIGEQKSALPDGECKGFDGQSREFDFAARKGDILIIAECKATARSIAFDRGDWRAINFRTQKLEAALDQVDEKARWLRDHATGSNYTIKETRAILPVVVTPFVEYLPSLSDRYWLPDRIPRVMTPGEFTSLLTKSDFDSMVSQASSTVFVATSL